MGWSWDLLDEFIGTDISKLTSATIPDLREVHPQASHWPIDYVLNSVLRARFVPQTNERVCTFLRRCLGAFEEYERASIETRAFVIGRADGKQPIRHYLSALHHWEQCVAAAWQALEMAMVLAGELAYGSAVGSVDGG